MCGKCGIDGKCTKNNTENVKEMNNVTNLMDVM